MFLFGKLRSQIHSLFFCFAKYLITEEQYGRAFLALTQVRQFLVINNWWRTWKTVSKYKFLDRLKTSYALVSRGKSRITKYLELLITFVTLARPTTFCTVTQNQILYRPCLENIISNLWDKIYGYFFCWIHIAYWYVICPFGPFFTFSHQQQVVNLIFFKNFEKLLLGIEFTPA